MRWVAVAPAALAACGRLAFDTHASSDAHADVRADTAADGAPASLLHDYRLVSSFADDLGGPALQALGGTLTAGGYQFAANAGLRLDGAVPASTYGIELTFQFSNVTGYNKVVDFKALGSDSGLYVYESQLQFVVNPITGCPSSGDCFTSPTVVFAQDTQAKLVISRDSAGTIACRVNDVAQFVFGDNTATGAFDPVGQTAYFFVDDTATNNEASPGVVRRIRIFDGPF